MSNYEKNLALRQGHGIASEDGYFEARPQIDSMDRRKVFGAGFERGWEAALAAEPAQERIQALELEVRQLTEQIAGLRHAPTPQADSQPAPVVEGTPPPCDQELFDQGVSVGLFDIPKWTAEALCRGIAAATEARVDWHYIAGRVHIKALPAARAPADSVLEDAAQLERERICAAIKAEDDYCVEHGDYMLDSDDCIKIARSEWVRPDYLVDAARKQGANHD